MQIIVNVRYNLVREIPIFDATYDKRRKSRFDSYSFRQNETFAPLARERVREGEEKTREKE